MILSKKSRLLVTLVVVCMCALSFGAEPNEPKTEVKFEVKVGQPPEALLTGGFRPPSESTHFAVLFIKGNWTDYEKPAIDDMLDTSAGKAMSLWQRDHILNQSIQRRDSGVTISNYTYFQIFGVSEADTEKMVKAFMELLGNKSRARRQSLLNDQQRFQEKIAEIEKQILQKETEAKDAKSRLEDVKKIVHYLSSEEAKRAVEELNKTLDGLNIEIVGIQVKLQAIAEEHDRARAVALKSDDARRKSYETIIWPRLEQMRIDEIIALKVAEAKKATAASIRNDAERFYSLSKQPAELEKDLNSLRATLPGSQASLEAVDHELAQARQLGSPPKVFQNKVTIYPVAGIPRR